MSFKFAFPVVAARSGRHSPARAGTIEPRVTASFSDLAGIAARPYQKRMSLESVRAFFAVMAPEIEVIVTEASSATVALAAEAHGVEPDQIAKTICLRVREQTMLIVASGKARLNNRKFKDRFGGKARMLDAEQVLEATSHPVGGVCPFGLPAPLPIYCDESLRRFSQVVPAAGATNAAVRLSPDRLADLTEATWVDVCD